MKQIDIRHCVQSLRLQLLDMSRVAQRAVDYSIKACSLGSVEAHTNVRDAADEINILHRETMEIASELLLMELPAESDLRFALSAEQIADALLSIYLHASEIAANSVGLQKNGQRKGYPALSTMGEVVNSLMRLCIVALFEEEAEHAETVLHHHGVARLFELTFYDWYRSIDRRLRAQASYELAITKDLSQMAKQSQELANAILFWLEGTEGGSAADADTEHVMTGEPELELTGHESVALPDGMETFLLSIDACFADTSFWSRL
jgi:phosphate uptake regulator